MPDTMSIYTDLKEQGLILSQGFDIGFPPIRAPKQGLIGQLTSYVVPLPKFEESADHNIIIVPILSNCFIVGRCNTLLCYKYQIDKQNSKPIICRPHVNNLRFKISKIHICDNKYLNDRGQIPFIVESDSALILYYVDLKQSKIVERNSLSYPSVLSVRFICEKEFVVMTNNHEFHHLIIQSGKLKLKNKFPSQVQIDRSTHIIRQINILGNIDQEQQSTICLFYDLKQINNDQSQIFRVKEYERDLDGKIAPMNDYIIVNTNTSVILTDGYEISSIDNYYCILLKHQILILKKKFDRYLFIDNVMEKVGGNQLRLHSNGIVTSHSGSSMQVNIILFNDPKCTSKLLDHVQIDNEISEGFIMAWPFKNQKDTSLMFAFKKQKRISFFNLIKMDPNAKMLMVVQNTPKQKISVVQEIATNLGINKKDFYLNQWAHSKRQLNDIYQFLLPCWCIQSIKKQLRMTMRRKKIEVSQLLKILQKLGKIIKNELKDNLNQSTLRQYIKNDFLLRKIKLKEASKRMDHRQMQKVYNSSLTDMFVQIVKNDLYPSEKQLDPLHVMVQEQIKQETNLKHVFQEFRMMILENYKKFLINFISEFSPEQIVNVIDNYHFLLPIHQFSPNLIIHEPDYMTEVQLNQMILKAAKSQDQWFSDMTSIEFARELSKERIEKQLHDYYANSKIHQAINTLINSEYGVKEKLHKHGLISCTMTEYKEKLKEIQDVKLFLKVCEHVNQYNLDSDAQEDDLSVQIVEIFKKKNKLEGKAYQVVRLYTSMHRFMLKHNFCQKKIVTAEELIQLRSEDLVALFFLENRQRKEFIFKEFRDLFVNLYGNPEQFNAVIDKFINSENCSRIQLQIFINEIKVKGEQFQVDNQDLIQLIIDGFCKKLQVREDSDTCRFLEIMQQIELSKKLGMKINKIIQVRKCLGIFNVFNCQKESYYNILRYQDNNEIFKILLDKYFTQQMKKDYIKIQDEQVSLDFCRNMLTVLLYLQQNVYYDIPERQLLLTYGEVLIEWKQFEVIKGIIYDQEVLEKLQIERESFIDELITRALDQIYYDEEIIYDPQTKQHIRNILDVYEGENDKKTQEFAKLELVQIFEKWGTIVHSYDIHTVTQQWQNGQRKQFIEDLINQYINSLDFEVFAQIYRYLEMASGKRADDVDLFNEQFVAYSLFYADKLLQEKKFEQILKILAFVKSMPQAQVGYALLSETFLQCLTAKFNTQESTLQARQAIQYFTQNFPDGQKIQRVYELGVESAKFQYSNQKQTTIEVNAAFCFRKHKAAVELNFLWSLAEWIYNEKKKNIQTLYYTYYFLIMIFRDPEHGFSKNHKISYSLEGLTDILFKLESKIDENSELWAINTFSLFKRFKKSLYLESITRIKQINTLQLKDFKNDETQLDVIKNILRQDKQRNSELLKCLTRVEAYLAAFKAVRKTQRQIRFQKAKIKDEPASEQIKEVQHQVEPEFNNATLNLRRLRQMKVEISNASAYVINQKDILEQIYQKQNQEKQQARRKNKPINKNANNFLLPLMNSAKVSVIADIEKKMYNQQWDKLKNYSREELIQAAQAVYNNEEKDFHSLITMFDQLNLTDKKKIEIGRLCKIYQDQTNIPPTSDLKKMFSFYYFVEPALEESEEEFRARTYGVIRPSFEVLIQGVDNQYIRNMANYIGSILSDNTYIAKFYIDVIMLLSKGKLDSMTVVRIRIIMNILRDYAGEVRGYMTNILQAYKENTELLMIIKQELLTCLQDLKEDDVEQYIKQF